MLYVALGFTTGTQMRYSYFQLVNTDGAVGSFQYEALMLQILSMFFNSVSWALLQRSTPLTAFT